MVASVASADLDWGCGQTQFRDADGYLITQSTGIGVLRSVVAGDAINFDTFQPAAPAELLTPGAVLNDGANVNRVLAISSAFHSGYLLNSAIPDVSMATQQALGASVGELLFVVTWDRQTFRNGLPTDNSRYILIPLYLDGNEQVRARTLSDGVSFFANVVYPYRLLERDFVERVAIFGGFNTFAGFADWAYQKFGMADSPGLRASDTNGNGRTLFEEYVFAEKPKMATTTRESGGSEAEYRAVVSLRANDTGLQYAVLISENLMDWTHCALEYVGEGWRSLNAAIRVVENHYVGEGVWSVAVAANDPAPSSRFFKFQTLEI